MALIVVQRNLPAPSYRKARWVLLALQQSQFTGTGQYVTTRVTVVRNHYVVRTGSRKKTLSIGLLLAGKTNKNVLLYRKLQPCPTQFYPVFTPWVRRVKALGVQVAPVIPVGTTGAGISLQHFLGLSLLSLGGLKY